MNKYIGILLIVLILTGLTIELTTPVVASTTIISGHPVPIPRGSYCDSCHVSIDPETGLPYPEL